VTGLILGLKVVAMNLLITIFPDAEKVGPDGSKGAKGPVGTRVCSGPYFAAAKEAVLANTPLGRDVTIEKVAPPNGGLLLNQLMIPTRILRWVNLGVCEPRVEAVDEDINKVGIHFRVIVGLSKMEEEFTPPFGAGAVRAPDQMVSVFDLAAVKAMGSGQSIVPVRPARGREKIITYFSDLDALEVKSVDRLSVCLPIDGIAALGRPLIAELEVLQVRRDREGFTDGLFKF
jgi:hypothetical protein